MATKKKAPATIGEIVSEEPQATPGADLDEEGAASIAEELAQGAEEPVSPGQEEPQAEPEKKKRGRPPGSKTKTKAREPGRPGMAVPSKAELRERVAELESELERARTVDPAIMAERIAPALQLTFGTAFRVYSRMRGEPKWALDNAEARELAEAWAPVVAVYVPDVAEHAPLVGALVVTAGVVLSRLEEEESPALQGKTEIVVPVPQGSPAAAPGE